MNWYNINAPDGCCGNFPDDGEVRLPSTVMVVGEMAPPVLVRQDSLDASVAVMDIGIMVPVGGGVPMACDAASITALLNL